MNSRSYLMGGMLASLMVFPVGAALAVASTSDREHEMDRTVAGLLADTSDLSEQETEGVGRLAAVEVEPVTAVPQQAVEVGVGSKLAAGLASTEAGQPKKLTAEDQALMDEVQSLKRTLAEQGYTQQQIVQIVEEAYSGQLDDLAS